MFEYQSRRAKATLEIDLERESPVGVLAGEDGVSREFSGWLELASAIEDWHFDLRAKTGGDRSVREGGSA